ncbi:MAG: PEP-CTERM sorting domain-containing protein [Sedimentisphaerales bacterium]|nr:PEP-CTERM sorting domain-containing protein [Sedimentisphaerales bacterium]
MVILVVVTGTASAAPLVTLSGSVTSANGYGQLRSEEYNHLAVFTKMGDVDADGYAVFGFDDFPANANYQLRVGVIKTSDWTNSVDDWNKGAYMHVEWTGGSDGRGYTVVDGVSDVATLGAVTITDLLGGVDSAVTITDLLGGVDSLIDIYLDSFSMGIQAKRGYNGTPTTAYSFDDAGYDSAYFIAQVRNLDMIDHEITVNGFVDAVPEPATIMLFGLGILALRRRHRA